jgi:hypothetical protein
MKRKLTFIIYTWMLVHSHVGWCFDGDIAINEPNFHTENFLDYKAYEFRKSVQEEWYTVENGWRVAGGSLGIDLAFVDTEIRLQKDLSDTLSVRLQHVHDVYYARKPVKDPLMEIAIRPWHKAIELSFLGTAAFDKRQADLGFAATLGERKANYLRLAWLSVDNFYNEKNQFDSSYYEQKPRTLSLQSAYRYGHLQLRLDVESDQPLTLVMPDTTSTFQYESEKLELVLDYHYVNKALFGITYRGWNTDKSLAEVVDNRSQTLSHHLIDFYWLRPIRRNDELTVGFRFDRFNNQVRDLNNANRDYDYRFDTWQVYGLLNHDYSAHAGWGLGLYIGHTEETKDYLSIATDDNADNELQGKLRTSWEYRSLNNKDRLTFHFSFNLDNLIDDPGDGAGISYQSLF